MLRNVDVFKSNLNWLFVLLVLGVSAINIFFLPPFWLILAIGILTSITILVLYNSISASKANRSRQSEAYRLQNIISNLPEGVIAYDSNFKILNFNPAAEQIFGLKASEIVGQSFTLKVKQDPSERLRPLLTILFPALAPSIIRLTDMGVYPQILDMAFKDPEMHLRVTTNRILDEKDNVLSYMKTVHDRTREIVMLRSKSEFITIASHQLRTPLTAVSWSLENLKKEPMSMSQESLISTATGASNRMLKIVNDLLDIAKIEEGSFGYQFQEINIIDFIEDVLSQADPIAKKYRIKLYFQKPKDATVKVYADPEKIGIVFSNLLDNAIKYNIPNGQVDIILEKMPPSYVQISIRDTGIGIQAEDLNRIFGKFFRAENASKAAIEGNGLGLYITKNIIRRHGGKIWVESAVNRGSTFNFTLPTSQSLIPAKEIVYEEE